MGDMDKLGWRDGDETLFGHAYLSFAWQTSKVLPILYRWLREAGGEISMRKLRCLTELRGTCDLVVNCCGLGASDLVGDSNMYPVSGHVLRAEAGWVGRAMFDSRPTTWAYILPNIDSVVLGS